MLRIFDTPEDMQCAAAWIFVEHVLKGVPGFISVATGNTTTPIHKRIADVYAAAPFNTRQMQLCCVDDYVGIPMGHMASCSTRVRKQLIEPLKLKDEQVLLPGMFGGDAMQAAHTYEKSVAERGGISIQFLGLGEDAHLGFCRPGTPLDSTAHAVKLPEDTRSMLSRNYSLHSCDLPEFGITLGIKSILRIPMIVVVANGEAKAQAVAGALLGPVTGKVPASALQLHPNTVWLIDKAAASRL